MNDQEECRKLKTKKYYCINRERKLKKARPE